MPDDDTKQLVIDALQAAARQVIEANGLCGYWLTVNLVKSSDFRGLLFAEK